jgi:hypothetical protein
MPQILVNVSEKRLQVPVPLTAVAGKIRVKNRSIVNEYGTPVATKQNAFKQSNYVEWQIGYDVVKKDIRKLQDSTLSATGFIGANNKEKALYELSEYIWYFYNWGIIAKEMIVQIKQQLESIENSDLIDCNTALQITRSHPVKKEINGFNFEYTEVRYPLLIHKFGQYEIITEIKITEKQRAVGVQPMLYLCFPITELRAENALIGRTAKTKEVAFFDVTEENISVFVKVLELFGTLSANHRHDVLQILDVILQ